VGELSYRNFDLLAGAERMENALKMAEGLRMDKYVVRFSMWRGRLLSSAAHVAEGRRWLDHARHVARGVPDPDLSRDVLLATADADARAGEYTEAVGLLREAVQIARQGGEAATLIECLLPLSVTLAKMGDNESAVEALNEARSVAEGVSDPLTECRIYRVESQVHYHGGDHGSAIRAAEMALEVAKESGLAFECVINAYRMGKAYLHLQDYKRAFASLRYSHDVAAEHGFTKLQMSNLRLLGFIDATHFDSEEGTSRINQVIKYADGQGYVWDSIHGRYLLAIVNQKRGDLAQAVENMRQAMKLASEHGHRAYVAEIEQGLRRLDVGEPIRLPL
jgi:tetratricopeptide (TPR) repeat protein